MSNILALLDFASTERQKEIIQAVEDCGSHRLAAEKLGVHHSSVDHTISYVKKKAAVKGFSPEHDYTKTVPEPFIAKGISTYYNKDGKPSAQWVKSALDQQQYIELLQQGVDLFYADLPKIQTPKAPARQKYDTDIIPWFQIGDAHLGMVAHEAETGNNFDLKIAVSEMMTAFYILFHEAKPSERCVINDLGDFTHYENFSGTTEASGHSLDLDGRFPKMIDYYIPLMRFIIEEALKKFKFVDIIINQGNHSRTNDIWMSRLLHHVYQGSDRVTVLNNSNVFTPYRMGNTFVMTHHSDKCRHKNLPGVMATDYPEEWGSCAFRYIDTGHVHHSFTSKEHPGVLVESWNILAPRDKYAHDGGYRSRQSITRLDRSRRYGNVGRRTLPVEEIHDRVRAGLTKNVKAGYMPKTKKKVYSV